MTQLRICSHSSLKTSAVEKNGGHRFGVTFVTSVSIQDRDFFATLSDQGEELCCISEPYSKSGKFSLQLRRPSSSSSSSSSSSAETSSTTAAATGDSNSSGGDVFTSCCFVLPASTSTSSSSSSSSRIRFSLVCAGTRGLSKFDVEIPSSSSFASQQPEEGEGEGEGEDEEEEKSVPAAAASSYTFDDKFDSLKQSFESSYTITGIYSLSSSTLPQQLLVTFRGDVDEMVLQVVDFKTQTLMGEAKAIEGSLEITTLNMLPSNPRVVLVGSEGLFQAYCTLFFLDDPAEREIDVLEVLPKDSPMIAAERVSACFTSDSKRIVLGADDLNSARCDFLVLLHVIELGDFEEEKEKEREKKLALKYVGAVSSSGLASQFGIVQEKESSSSSAGAGERRNLFNCASIQALPSRCDRVVSVHSQLYTAAAGSQPVAVVSDIVERVILASVQLPFAPSRISVSRRNLLATVGSDGVFFHRVDPSEARLIVFQIAEKSETRIANMLKTHHLPKYFVCQYLV